VKIAVQQPYFIPYAGYFELHKKIDTFVIFDDVQFNRRGFVHRNKIKINKDHVWITLPLMKKKRDTKINELEFDLNSQQFHKYCNLIKILKQKKQLKFLINDFENFDIKPIDYIHNINCKILSKLGIENKFLFASEISNKKLSGEKKIIDICKKLNATEYFNLAGGKNLYDTKNFLKEGIKINFLPNFNGEKISIIHNLIDEKLSI